MHCWGSSSKCLDLSTKLINWTVCFVFKGKCVVPVFSTMAGLCGMAVGVIAWCHQQLKSVVYMWFYSDCYTPELFYF